MENVDVKYFNLLLEVLNSGEIRKDRTGVGTRSLFGRSLSLDVSSRFPLLTTKKVNFNSIKHELIWFLRGDTNIKYLLSNGVHIWSEWAYENYLKYSGLNVKKYHSEWYSGIRDFENRVLKDDYFGKVWGNLGPVYGKQWRNFNGIDQISNVIGSIKTNPESRRHIVSAWNPGDEEDMLLPPCHILFQFYVSGNHLDISVYQRSADIFLGVPFNIASYTLLLYIIASATSLKPRNLIYTFGDLHLYSNHVKQAEKQMSRDPFKYDPPYLSVNTSDGFENPIITLFNYYHYPYIKAEVAV